MTNVPYERSDPAPYPYPEMPETTNLQLRKIRYHSLEIGTITLIRWISKEIPVKA